MQSNLILVTGGAGYIGSQTVKELISESYKPIVFDNLVTGHKEAIGDTDFILGDLKNINEIDLTLKKYHPDAVIHFAASTEVEESVRNPEKYFENNVENGKNLLKAMRQNNVNKIIFSSSAAVYGNVAQSSIKEDAPKKPTNPYGQTKLDFEKILAEAYRDYQLQSISLRYFNAAGADPGGKIEPAVKKPTLLITRAILTALGKYPYLEIFGDDYNTPDGTCVRDFIHVKDLAIAHILALKALEMRKFSPIYNLGTGYGYSVKDVVEMTKKVSGIDFEVKISPRRPGDSEKVIADASLAKEELGFIPQYSDLKTIIETAWQWHSRHIDGYNNKSEIRSMKSETNSKNK